MPTNPPIEQWGRVFTITFTVPNDRWNPDPESPVHDPRSNRPVTFMVGKTRGPDGTDSIVHSVRPEIIAGEITWLVYYTVIGANEEILWQAFSGHPYTVKFDTKGGAEWE